MYMVEYIYIYIRWHISNRYYVSRLLCSSVTPITRKNDKFEKRVMFLEDKRPDRLEVSFFEKSLLAI